jgi:hypothetical protein
MYGVEANSRGRGGLAAGAPGGDVFFPSALGIRPTSSAIIGGPPQSGVLLPFSGDNNLMSAPPTVGSGGSAVETPVSRQQNHWSAVLDFHNSTAPWILIGILVLYGWIHLSVRAGGRAGRARGHLSAGF